MGYRLTPGRQEPRSSWVSRNVGDAEIGDYRILYEIDDKKREVHVYRVERKGKDTYRR